MNDFFSNPSVLLLAGGAVLLLIGERATVAGWFRKLWSSGATSLDLFDPETTPEEDRMDRVEAALTLRDWFAAGNDPEDQAAVKALDTTIFPLILDPIPNERH